MIKYYIKDGDSEKGPLTVAELKKLGIRKTTFVRQVESFNWVEAGSLHELKSVFKSKFRVVKITVLILLGAFVIGSIVNGLLNQYYGASYNFNQLAETEEAIPPPPEINYTVTRHKKKFFGEMFKNCNLSGNKRELIEACDYTNSTVRNSAVSIAGQDAGNYNIGQICDIFDYCYDNWKYVNDPKGIEMVENASRTIDNGLNGDCDDFAVLVCSMVLSIGGEARINYAYGAEGGHAFAEVNIGNTEIEDYISKRYTSVYDNSGIWTRKDIDGTIWLNLDWFATHPGGKYFDYTQGTSFYILQKYCADFSK
jgi:hypothetical protein